MQKFWQYARQHLIFNQNYYVGNKNKTYFRHAIASVESWANLKKKQILQKKSFFKYFSTKKYVKNKEKTCYDVWSWDLLRYYAQSPLGQIIAHDKEYT